ncbi:MAG: hypothetical protein INR71_02195 [Terriglobus roseus]|nr:hypothetical protein [Terriglobus roseus]
MADDAREKLRSRQQDASGVRIWSGRSADKRGSTSSKLRTELERDFTVPGTPSKLACPFAVPRANGSVSLGQRSLPTPRSSASRASGSAGAMPRRLSLLDPVKGDICGNDPMSPAVSEHGSSALCPIRFMDQHSPEEVADYFEKHKHQIPRSHEVCIKRYQSNAESIKQLDAKYGSLVSMIQGLGQKHQPILAEKEVDPGATSSDEPARESVSQWANDVSASLQNEKIAATPNESEERTPHFDRPLKEIRVGESPSRPWGIHVPAGFAAVEGGESEASAITASPQELSAAKEPGAHNDTAEPEAAVKRCPFDHTKLGLQGPKAAAPKPAAVPPAHAPPMPAINSTNNEDNNRGKADAGMRAAEPSSSASRMVFTGPVFIGYPIEQALQLIREGGLAPKP